MPEPSPFFDLIPKVLPFECLQARFMQLALVGLLLLAPMAAAMGVHVVALRMSFFSDAISHSVFAGVAIGLLIGLDADLAVIGLALAVGLGIVAVQRRTALAPDAVIGVFFSAVVAFGLAVVSRSPAAAGAVQGFVYGDILTMTERELAWLGVLFLGNLVFHLTCFNRMLCVGFNPSLAAAHGVRVTVLQTLFGALLALVVVSAVRAVGILLVTALLIVPAASARNLARSARGMFWWAQAAAVVSAAAGLLVSAQSWAATATGATVVLVNCLWFAVTCVVGVRGRRVGPNP